MLTQGVVLTHLLHVGCYCATCRVECLVLSTGSQSQWIFVAKYVLCSNICSLMSIMSSCTWSTRCKEFAFIFSAGWKEKKVTFFHAMGQEIISHSCSPLHLQKCSFNLLYSELECEIKWLAAATKPFKPYWTSAHTFLYPGRDYVLVMRWGIICLSQFRGNGSFQPREVNISHISTPCSRYNYENILTL